MLTPELETLPRDELGGAGASPVRIVESWDDASVLLYIRNRAEPCRWQAAAR